VAAGCAAVLALLGLGVLAGFEPQRRLDAAVSEAVYAGDDRDGSLEALLQVLTAPGLTVVRCLAALPVLVWLVRRQAWRLVLWVVAAAALLAPVITALKDLFGRVRPDFAGGGARYDSLSFPSGHAAGVAALVSAALLLAWPFLAPAARRTWAVLGVLLVLLVGLTRMWLGVHYLTDVLAGWALGLGWVLLLGALLGVLPDRRREPT
jgi:undecaprenyl-diphosphatase